jgi:ATP-dependent helicase/nuclease subunit B
MEYGLRAKPRKEAKFGAPEVGSFVHDVLEHAIRDLCRDPEQKPEALVANHVNRYLREALQGREDSARFRATFDRIGRNILEILRNVWEEIRCGDFKPACFELDFSREGDLPPLEVQTGSVTLRLGGKIDRVDAFLKDDTLYLKVVDYKTGVKEFHLSDLLYGLNLQMFLYLLMLQRSDPQQVCKVLDLPADASIGSVIPAAALYIPTKAPFVAGDRADTAADLQKKLDKELRRKGILRSDGGIPDALEHAVGGEYRFLPVRLNKNGDFDAKSAVADAAQMGRLLRQTETVLQEIGASLANGDIEATPYRKGFDFTACQWCDYRAACHFDTTMKKDTYRFHPAMDNAEVHARLEAEELQQEGGDNHG